MIFGDLARKISPFEILYTENQAKKFSFGLTQVSS